MGAYAINIIIGLFLVILGILFILDQSGAIDFRFWGFIGDIWPLALIIFGLWMIYDQTRKPRNYQQISADLRNIKSFGSINAQPGEIGNQGAEYRVGFGDLKIDLSSTAFALGEQLIEVNVGFGDLQIILPRVTSVSIKCNCGLGDIRLLDNRKSGITTSLEHTDPEFDNKQTRVKILAKCGMGDIRVEKPREKA